MAGQRVQIIKPDKDKGGYLEFGTELVPAADKSLVALLGASPGASTAAFITTEVLKVCFADRLTEDDWLPALKRLFPTYGIDLAVDADACRKTLRRDCSHLEAGECLADIGFSWSPSARPSGAMPGKTPAMSDEKSSTRHMGYCRE